MADKNRLTCPICKSTFFNLFPAGECQTCQQLVCGHCIQHGHPDHETSICQTCVLERTPYGQLSELKVKELVEILLDPETEQSPLAATVIGEKNDLTAVPSLCKALKSCRIDVRREAAKALGKLGSKEAATSLTDGLKDPEPVVRSNCIASLAKLNVQTIIPQIKEMLNDTSKQVAGYAVHALARLQRKDSSITLNNLVINHSEPFIRAEALLALSRLDPDTALEAALNCLKDDKKSVQISACKILEKLNNPQSIPGLIELIDSKPSTTVRMKAFSVLNKIEAENSP